MLWAHLKNKQLLGYKFRRQYSVGAYVIDFYCPELRLAIELDGKSHNSTDAREHDSNRQNYLEQFDILFLRFRDEEVFDDINKVMASLRTEIQASQT